MKFFIALFPFCLLLSYGLDYSDWNSGKSERKKALEETIKAKRKPIKKLEDNKKQNKTKIKALERLREEMLLLSKKAKVLFGIDSVFKGSEVSSADNSVIDATYQQNSVSKPLDNYQFRVNQLAQGQKIMSGEIEPDITLLKSSVKIEIGKQEVEFDFDGGGLYDFVSAFNKQMKPNLRVAVINRNGKKILILTSKITGKENFLRLAKDSSDLFTRLKLFKLQSLPPIIDKKELKKEYKNYFVSNKVVLFPDEKMVLIPKKDSFFNTNNQFNFFFKSQSDKFLEKQNHFSKLTTKEENTKKNFVEKNIEIFPSIPVVEQNNKVGVMEVDIEGETKSIDLIIEKDRKVKSFIYLLEDFVGYTEDKKVMIQKIIFLNRSKKKKYSFNIPFFLTREKKYKPNKVLMEPKDSVLEYEGMKFENASNRVDNLIDGLTLNLKKTSDQPIDLKVANNSSKIKDAIIDYINYHNDFIHFLNVITARDEIPDNINKDYKEYYGILMDERNLSRMRNRFRNLLTKQYKEEKELSHLFVIGISPYYNKNEALNTAKIDFKEKEFDSSIQKIDFEILKEIFAVFSSEEKKFISGYAYEIEKLVREYTSGTRIKKDKKTFFASSFINLKINSWKKENKEIDKDIVEEEENIEEFRSKTLEEFAKIENAEADLKRAQQQLRSIGR